MPSTNLKRANAASRKFDRPKTTAIKCSAGRCGVRGIVFQNPICLHRQRVAVMRARIHIDSDHVRPFFEILPTCWRELTLIILRPALIMAMPSTQRHARTSEAELCSHKFSCCCNWRNRRRNPSGYTLSPGNAMQNEENQPSNKCKQTAWNSDEHEPAHHT